MSLTSFLKDADEVRIVLEQTFEKPEIGITKEWLAEPQTANYALIGTAFDYVLRFWLEREYSQVESKPWVAHQGLNLAQLMEMETTTEDSRDFSEVIASIEQSHQEYLETGDMTGELLASTLDLARFDWIYRSGRPPENLGEALEGDIEDLRRLYDIIPRDEFRGRITYCSIPRLGPRHVW
jgi:hypothetical protein